MSDIPKIELPRLENESARAYAARVDYVTAGPGRSQEAVSQKLAKRPILPFSEIDRRGAGMYKGQSRAASIDGDAPGVQPGEGGSTPTAALQTNPESHE